VNCRLLRPERESKTVRADLVYLKSDVGGAENDIKV
jgi:hypothetical protein